MLTIPPLFVPCPAPFRTGNKSKHSILHVCYMTLRRFSLLPTCSIFQKSCAKNNGFQLFSHKCICVVISQISGEREKLSISKVSDLMKFSVKPRMAPGAWRGLDRGPTGSPGPHTLTHSSSSHCHPAITGAILLLETK